MLPETLAEDSQPDPLAALYGPDPDELDAQRTRQRRLLERFIQLFGQAPRYMYSSPGRCELGGNHTDHNGGQVLATAINLDVLGAFSTTVDPVFTVYSTGFDTPFTVDLRHLEPQVSEHPTTQLLRGIAFGFTSCAKRIGGLNAVIDSAVLFASGLSSSAALEVLFASVLNELFNDSSLTLLELAIIGQEAEHRYWGKPVGLLDQMTIGTGGLVQISFRNTRTPEITPIPFNFDQEGYQLALVNPGGNHSLLTSDYREIPEEMMKVALHFNCSRLIDTDWSQVLAEIPILRSKVGDRAILRAIHFFEENTRVNSQALALKRRDMRAFLRLVKESGSSSWRLLQNCYQPNLPKSQPLALALAVTETLAAQWESEIAYRVHGGGFGGTILVIMPKEVIGPYRRHLEAIFGASSVQPLEIRKYGCVSIERLSHPEVNIAPT